MTLQVATSEMEALLARERAAQPVWVKSLPLTVPQWSENMLSMNDRLHPQVKAPKTKYWRTLGRVCGGGGPKLPGGRVVVYFRLPKQGKGVRTVKEVANLQPVVKALIDGLVDAGVFPDDDDARVWAQDARRLPFTGRCEVIVSVWA